MGAAELISTLVGAVALLLWGVRMVRTGLTRAFATILRDAIGRASRTRVSAFGAGLGVTVILQSSTATALLLSSFAGRGLIVLPVALAMMLGADVGSTLVAQVFAFDIKWLWAFGVFAGFVAFNASEHVQVKAAGRIAIGLGLMLLALNLIGDVSSSLRESVGLKSVFGTLGAVPVLAVGVAAVVTWLAHSSLAMILLIMSLAASGAIGPVLAGALVVGANLGGSLAPYFALSGAAVQARRVALGNVAARGTVAILVLPLMIAKTDVISWLAADAARQVLNAHTLFNVIVATLWLPLTAVLARFATLLLPDRAVRTDDHTPQHLDPSVLQQPSEALGSAMRETLHVGDLVLDMLKRSRGLIESTDPQLIKDIGRDDDRVDRLHEAIKLYLIRLPRTEMSEAETRQYMEILAFITNLEHIGDIIDKNLMELAQRRMKKGLSFSKEGRKELIEFHTRVADNMTLALKVFATRDVGLARQLLLDKSALRAESFDASERHFARLREGRAESLDTSSLHLDVIRDLKRINSHLTSVAYPILEQTGELIDSRLRRREDVAAPSDRAARQAE